MDLKFVVSCAAALVMPLMASPLKVAALHPLLADACRQIGGAHVEVVDLIGPQSDPHAFRPAPADLARIRAAKLYLASGMGLESWLPAVKSIIPPESILCEVGASLPALQGSCEHESHDEPHHHHGLDPHWWHSIPLFIRATGIIEGQLASLDPAHATEYAANARDYRQRLDKLAVWARREISRIPRDRRQLATAHAAFGYFCKDFGFTPHPLQGVTREQMPSPAALASLIGRLRAANVSAVFPETRSNPKILAVLTKDTGISLGGALIADGSDIESYEAMVRHNISTIANALAPER